MPSKLQSTTGERQTYTVSELAEAMSTATSTIYALITAGHIKAIPWGLRGKRIPAIEYQRVLTEGIKISRREEKPEVAA